MWVRHGVGPARGRPCQTQANVYSWLASRFSKASKLYGRPRKSATESAAGLEPPLASTRSRYAKDVSLLRIPSAWKRLNMSSAITSDHM